MTLFWIIMAAMILVALAMLAPALLRERPLFSPDRDRQNVVIARDRLAELEVDLENGRLSQEVFDQSKVELEQALLLDLEQGGSPEPSTATKGEGRRVLAVLGVTVPILTVGLYLFLGTPQMVDRDGMEQASSRGQTAGEVPSMEEVFAVLNQRVQENPEDTESWFMLGRGYSLMEEYSKAAETFERLHQLAGDDPAVMLALADALAMGQGGSTKGRPAELIRKAVELEPNGVTALWMAGMVEEQAGDYPKALAYWRRLEPLLEGEAESQGEVRTLIERTEAKAGTMAAPQ